MANKRIYWQSQKIARNFRNEAKMLQSKEGNKKISEKPKELKTAGFCFLVEGYFAIKIKQ